MRKTSAAWLLSALLLAGCGGSSHDTAQKQITSPAYNGYPAVTFPVTSGTPAQCRREAQVFARAAVDFLRPYPSDSDVYMILARLKFNQFKAHQCDVSILRDAFARRATPKQRRTIVGRVEFAFLGDTASELTGS